MIGKKLYKGQYTNNEYADTAIWCNANNAHIEDKGEYYEVVKNAPYIPSLQEQVLALESQYGMNRWQREGILADGSLFSDYTKAKAQEIETLAAQLREENKN
jgi:hypothetical protein